MNNAPLSLLPPLSLPLSPPLPPPSTPPLSPPIIHYNHYQYTTTTTNTLQPLLIQLKKTHPDNRKIYIDNKVPDDYEHFKYCDNEIISSKVMRRAGS